MRPALYNNEDCYKEDKKKSMKKKWYRSKTLWINFIGIVVIFSSAAGVDDEIVAAIVAAEGGILAVINLILRLITKQGLEK